MQHIARRGTRPLRVLARTGLRRTCHLYPGWYNRRDVRSLERQRRRAAVHEPDLVGIATSVPVDALVLDVGANYGQSVLSIKALLPRARVVSFEPNPEALTRLIPIASRYPDVEVRPVGVGAAPARIDLHVPVVGDVVFHQMATLRPLLADDLVRQLHGDGFRWARAEHVRWRTLTIDVVALDSFGLAPALVKIDVEGGEAAVLDGAAATLAHRPLVVVERGLRPEVRDRLEPLGYEAVEWYGGAFHPASGRTLNTYFRPPSLAGAPA